MLKKLIQAFAKIKSDVQLVLIGPDDFFKQRLLRYINTTIQKEKVIFYHNPTKEDLIFFYKNALALIHPSLSEGFGLPLIEAAYFRLPIIASDIAVFREILGSCYISFNPYNVEDITNKMNYFLRKRPSCNYGEINKYSFEKMAEQTLKIYTTLL